MSNRLQFETSPYLLQHKDNPVDWYPWCDEAFARARAEDKPIFLSIGYSTCHWCHVLAHESFEDSETAELLNRYFISVKVDREERPDIDSVYMSVCQAFTGSGGWPTSIFMTAEQKPFFAGTYFPKPALRQLLLLIHQKWRYDRRSLLEHADSIVAALQRTDSAGGCADRELVHLAAERFKRSYDSVHGGFGRAPKFPTPHKLLFLLEYYAHHGDSECLQMAEHTLTQMYRGGLFDHIGFGFCRYSTDKRFLVPHFEKMLYDNALLILAYCKAYAVTKKPLYLDVAQKTADYILREMTSSGGGFYSAQDADSEGEEGSYYLLTPSEVISVIGKEAGDAFNRRFDITEAGNFEGKSIPNLLKSEPTCRHEHCLAPLREYRKRRHSLHRDDKILTAWSSLMTAAMCELYLVSGNELYLDAAKRADTFTDEYLYDGDSLYVSFRDGRRGARGFLDDYACCIFCKLALYRATAEKRYVTSAEALCDKVLTDFADSSGGFYMCASDSEQLIMRPKETYDGAMPCGNSLMAYSLVRLALITDSEKYRTAARRLLDFLAAEAEDYPQNHAMLLVSLLAPTKITAVLDKKTDKRTLLRTLPQDAVVIVQDAPTAEYPLKNNATTYYVCKDTHCLPPTNDPPK